MAVAKACFQNDWDEWSHETEEERREEWTQWAEEETNEEDERKEEWEEKDREDEGCLEGIGSREENGGQPKDKVKSEDEEIEGESDREERVEDKQVEEEEAEEQEIEEIRVTEEGEEQGTSMETDDEEEVKDSDSDLDGPNDEGLDQMVSEDESYDPEEDNAGEGAPERQCGRDVVDMTVHLIRTEESLQHTLSCEEFKNDEEETLLESCSTWDDQEELPVKYEDEDEEEAEEDVSPDDMDCDDEDIVKIYRETDYPTDLFHTLTEFRDSALLTDLILRTETGKTFHVHSLVLSAISAFISERLSRANTENNFRRDDDEKNVGIIEWSLDLGPDVDNVGLEAIIDFAYTGLVPNLDMDTIEQIQHAAKTLSVPRLMDLCKKQDSAHSGETAETEEEISALEQTMITLRSIKQLWEDRVGCDVALEGIGDSLHVHRVVLAASSDYFRGMFTLGMKEAHQPRVALPFVMSSELEALISCSYSGLLPLSWRSIFELTSTALQLQVRPGLSLCLRFLEEDMNPESCLDVVSFAEAYEMAQLLETAEDFVLRQFQKVACTSKFKDLPARQLLKYLNSHSLCVQSELVVFKAVVAWIQARPKVRLKLAKELMKTVHFPLMTFKEFKEVKAMDLWAHQSLEELYQAVFEEFCSNEIEPQSQYRIYLPKESLVLIGGDRICEDLGTRCISKELWFGNSLLSGIRKTMEWRKLGEMPEQARFSHEVAVMRGQLYVFGGKKYYGLGDTLNSVLRYDPIENSWENLADMLEKRCFFSVLVLDGQIYAIGGHCDPEYMDSVERYCPITNSWSFTRPLELPLSGHMAKVAHGKIFISGGRNSDYTCLASMFQYHPETGSTHLANMTQPRTNHCMETLNDRLYVAGGITVDQTMTGEDLLTCEMYSPLTNTWTSFMSLSVPHVGAGSAVLEGKFYVFGGYSQEDYSDTKIIHRFDPTLARWENMGRMPGPNNDLRAALLCLPQHFRK